MQFSRQIVLPEIGKRGQQKIRKAHVSIIGAGSLGCWSALLLGSMGIGSVTIADRDLVDESNLYHQPLYTEKEVGEPKASAAAKKFRMLFPATIWIAHDIDVNSSTISQLKADVILDCTDNLQTRYLLNEWAVKNMQKWVHAAAVGTAGNVAAFSPTTACFRCLYPKAVAQETCETAGIYNPLASMVASIQVSQAINIILGIKPTNELSHITDKIERIRLNKNPACPVCGKKEFPFLSQKPQNLITFCGGSVYQATVLMPKMAAKYQKRGPLTVFKNGRVLIKAASQNQAISLLNRYFPV